MNLWFLVGLLARLVQRKRKLSGRFSEKVALTDAGHPHRMLGHNHPAWRISSWKALFLEYRPVAFGFPVKIILLGFLAHGGNIFAVVDQAVNPSDRLEFLVININGITQKVKAGEELVAVVGDLIEIRSAVLGNPNRKVDSVNLVGFQSPKAPRKAEDRGYEVRTDRDLMKYWSVNKRGEIYRIRATSGSTTHGEAFIRLIKPKIKFAELTVNGQKRLLREGELLRLKKTDQISINEVRTNIDQDTEEVDFQIIPNQEVKLPGVRLFEIRFSRAGSIFAKIPMQVEGYEEQPEN